MPECVLVGKTEGSEQKRYFGDRHFNAGQPWWTDELGRAEIFSSPEDARSALTWLRYAMEQHHGYDLKTKKPILEVAPGTPLRRIGLPTWAYTLLGLSKKPGSVKLEGVATVHVMQITLELTDEWIEFSGQYPTK